MRVDDKDDEDRSVGGAVRRDLGGIFRAIGKFADGGIGAILDPDEDEKPAPPAPRASSSSSSSARPVVVDVAPEPCACCGGRGRLDVKGADGRVRTVVCPDCGVL